MPLVEKPLQQALALTVASTGQTWGMLSAALSTTHATAMLAIIMEYAMQEKLLPTARQTALFAMPMALASREKTITTVQWTAPILPAVQAQTVAPL